MSLLASLVGAVLDFFLRAWQGERARADNDGAHERAGAAEAANETQQTIAEIADARSALNPPPDDPDALAHSLRARARAAGRGRADSAGAGHAGGA